MLVTYELYDREGEPLMRLEGKKYIAPIGSLVAFYDAVSEGVEFVSVEFIGKATHQWYNITSNQMQFTTENNDSVPNERGAIRDSEKLHKVNR